MKILFITNIPSPYRIDFFNELGKNCELTVCFERRTADNRNKNWKSCNAIHFREQYADVKPHGTDQSVGLGIIKIIRVEKFDHLIIAGYASPSVMFAIIYCRLHGIHYYIESDGAFFQKDIFPKRILKKYLISGADAIFTTCGEHIAYLRSLGIPGRRIKKYPFTSLKESDIIRTIPTVAEKRTLRMELEMSEDKIVLSVGQFIHRKGFDILMAAAQTLPETVGIYIVGGVPGDEYLAYKDRNGLSNVHFVDFKEKKILKKWYMAADCFVLPTREDIWGLVVNEAMANGLPVITTNRCNAGLELVQEGKNGYILPPDDAKSLGDAINRLFVGDSTETMGNQSLRIIQNYTIKKMSHFHLQELYAK